MTLFDASSVYAPGEPRGYTGDSSYMNVNGLGRYHLNQLKQPSVIVGLVVLAVVVYLISRGGRRK